MLYFYCPWRLSFQFATSCMPMPQFFFIFENVQHHAGLWPRGFMLQKQTPLFPNVAFLQIAIKITDINVLVNLPCTKQNWTGR